MIEKIGLKGYETISSYSDDVINIIKSKKENNIDKIGVCEIGVGIGATSVEIVKNLGCDDDFYFFGFEEDVRELYSDLIRLDYCKCNLYPMGNSHKIYDSYCWNLGILSKNKMEIFDVVYLDGAHDFFCDGLACSLLKRLTKKEGVIVFDDVTWSHSISPTIDKIKLSEEYTDEQISTCQVGMIIDVFMDTDTNWKRIDSLDKNRACYAKIG